MVAAHSHTDFVDLLFGGGIHRCRLLPQFRERFRELWIGGKVVLLIGIVLQVVQFLDLGRVLVVNKILPAFCSYAMTTIGLVIPDGLRVDLISVLFATGFT